MSRNGIGNGGSGGNAGNGSTVGNPGTGGTGGLLGAPGNNGAAAFDMQGQNEMNDFFFLFSPIFKILDEIPQELALIIALLLLA